MATLTFDTLKFASRLIDAGVPEAQAKAESEGLAEVLAVSSEGLATKNDILAMQQRIETQFVRLEGEMKMNRWMLAVVMAAVFLPIMQTMLP